MSFSYNDLAEATRNILSNNGKTSAVQDYLSQNKLGQQKSDWQKNVEAKTGYSLTQADGWNPFTDSKEEAENQERIKAFVEYQRSHGRPDYVYGGNNFGTLYNNTASKSTKKKVTKET